MNPQPGDYFVVRTGGWQAKVIRMATASQWNHAGIYLGDDRTVEAAPHGAHIGHPPTRDVVWSHMDLAPETRTAVCAAATWLLGRPYGWLDIACIALGVLGVEPGPVARRISDNGTLICSQLVDLAYFMADVHLFNDGRIMGMVTPDDIGRLIV